MLFTQNLSGGMFQQQIPPPPRVKNLSWCLVIAVHMFSCYLQIKMPGKGGILPCYLHRRYRSIFSKEKSLRSKLPWCFYLSYQMCVSYITIYLHINYRISFYICLPQWLKLSRCLYLNYQVYGVNVIVLFTEIIRGRVQQIYSQWSKLPRCLKQKVAKVLKAKTCQKQYFS